VSQLKITPNGVEGDFNRWRTEEANGDPDQAVLLLTQEILADLRKEGWPVQAGELGENLTLADRNSFGPCWAGGGGSPGSYTGAPFEQGRRSR